MPSAALLRLEIENALQDRFPAALTPVPRTIREVAATGIAPVDELLDGGLPIGAISEVTGPVSSGRTSLAVAFLARRTAEGRVCAWVDVDDVFDPESAAASGVALPQLLWVRCREANSPKKACSVHRVLEKKKGRYAHYVVFGDYVLVRIDIHLAELHFAIVLVGQLLYDWR